MTTQQRIGLTVFGACMAAALAMAEPEKKPVDPGVRGGAAGAGGPLKSLTADETAFFQDGLARFAEIESVTGGQNNGLGPRFNSNQCLSCHSQPAGGGSSPTRNPLIQVATLSGIRLNHRNKSAVVTVVGCNPRDNVEPVPFVCAPEMSW